MSDRRSDENSSNTPSKFAAVAARGGGEGAAAGVTGDAADAGAWPDDVAPDRGSAVADDPDAPPPEEDEAAKLGDFA